MSDTARTSEPVTNTKPGVATETSQIFVSYVVLVVSLTAFILVTVGLGLIVSLVNVPKCEESSSRLVNFNRVKRELFDEKDQHTILKELNEKKPLIKVDPPFCMELIESPVGQPWEKKRLPGNIVPSKYEITLRTPIFAADRYSGEVTIRVTVKEPLNYVLLHSRSLSDYLPTVKDSLGNEYEIACIGDYLPNDYHVIKTVNTLQPGEYTIDLFFTGDLKVFSNGIFEIKYNNNDNEFDGNMLASHFKPVDARLAYPCFDEPEYKASYVVKLYHPLNTTGLSNVPVASEGQVDGELLTVFEETIRLPTYMVAMILFRKSDFSSKTLTTNNNLQVTMWARNTYVEGGLVDDSLKMFVDIFNAFDFLFTEVPQAVPKKLDIFAIPYYPEIAVGHHGLFVFRETDVLFMAKNVQERTKQAIALEMAKQIAELWFGNYVTFKWWNELWLQESMSDYLKYYAVNKFDSNWRVNDQFVTEELINVLYEDSYPSSHPVIKNVNSPEEIDQLFDVVETSKGAAILRMMENEIGTFNMILGIINYLKQSGPSGLGDADTLWNSLDNIRIWKPKDFADRWFRQSNYPLAKASIVVKNGLSYLNIQQERFKSDYSIFSNTELYPSPYNWTWYLPLTCTFGIRTDMGEAVEIEFDVETKNFEQLIGDGMVAYKWLHCDTNFAGYYMMDYTAENWDLLGDALNAKIEFLSAFDRANIIHNLFMNTFSGKTTYDRLVREIGFLKNEREYLPWKTAIKHATDLASVLEYRRSFIPVSDYFVDLVRGIESVEDLWTPSGNHVEDLKKEALLDFACRMQDVQCLRNASALWTDVLLGSNTNLAPHVRSVVYNYHIQNSYDTDDWKLIFLQYESILDIQDRDLLLKAVSYSRLPWILIRFLQEISNDELQKIEFFETLSLIGQNQLGREIAWNYYRANFGQIVMEYGYENLDIGRSLIDITKSFSDVFYYFELLEFIYGTDDGANGDARLRAVEIVSTNVIWIESNEIKIIDAFGKPPTVSAYTTSIEDILTVNKLKSQLFEAFKNKLEKKFSNKI